MVLVLLIHENALDFPFLLLFYSLQLFIHKTLYIIAVMLFRFQYIWFYYYFAEQVNVH